MSEEVLDDLIPDERLRLTLEAEATGREGWMDRLRETCPRYEYTNVDHEFRYRVRSALLLAYRAVYDLHTTYLEYQFARNEWEYHMILDYERDEDPSDEDLERLSERAEDRQELFVAFMYSITATGGSQLKSSASIPKRGSRSIPGLPSFKPSPKRLTTNTKSDSQNRI